MKKKRQAHDASGRVLLSEIVDEGLQILYATELIERVRQRESSTLIVDRTEGIEWVSYLLGPVYNVFRQDDELLRNFVKVEFLAAGEEREVLKKQFLDEFMRLKELHLLTAGLGGVLVLSPPIPQSGVARSQIHD